MIKNLVVSNVAVVKTYPLISRLGIWEKPLTAQISSSGDSVNLGDRYLNIQLELKLI